jgi:hypothetical protein
VHFVTKASLHFWILRKKTDFLIPDMNYLEKKKFTLLFRPQSADRKSLNELQRARKHFQTLIVFLKYSIFLFMPNADSNPFFFIYQQLTVVNVHPISGRIPDIKKAG